MSNHEINFNIKKLVEFFDSTEIGWRKHVNGLNSIIGEDAGKGLFEHYLKYVKKVKNVEVINQSPRTGKLKGPRLDRWIKTEWKDGRKTLFQTEIKNWSSSAFGGRNLPIKATQKEIKSYTDYTFNNWCRNYLDSYLGNDSEARRVNKVLTKMNDSEVNDSGKYELEPLLIYWVCLDHKRIFFPYKVKLKNSAFRRVWIFSMSAYLRYLLEQGQERISLDMPDAYERMSIMFNMYDVK